MLEPYTTHTHIHIGRPYIGGGEREGPWLLFPEYKHTYTRGEGCEGQRLREWGRGG